MSDASLKASINANKAKRDKYRRVRSSISSNQLSTQQNLSTIEDFIDECQDVVDKIDEHTGYGYLSNLKTKLAEDIKTMEEYRDFVRDSNTSFINLYNDLGDLIDDLNEQITADRNAYNKDKEWWEKLYW